MVRVIVVITSVNEPNSGVHCETQEMTDHLPHDKLGEVLARCTARAHRAGIERTDMHITVHYRE